jgi:hypothetical protein
MDSEGLRVAGAEAHPLEGLDDGRAQHESGIFIRVLFFCPDGQNPEQEAIPARRQRFLMLAVLAGDLTFEFPVRYWRSSA